MKDLNNIMLSLRALFRLSLVLATILALVLLVKFNYISWTSDEDDVPVAVLQEEKLPGEIGTIDEESGLIIDHGFLEVKMQCGACHSTRLVAQNKFSRQGWIEVIRWMQEKQNLWDLGEMEVIILDYLEKNNAPGKTGRRKKLENINWYVLNE